MTALFIFLNKRCFNGLYRINSKGLFNVSFDIKTAGNSFHAYTKYRFDKESHIRLSKMFKELDKKGCFLMLTNHDTELIRDLYSEYNIEVVNVKRNVNSNGKNRKGVEVIITNYQYNIE
ncbi:DNA adenine methylase [Mycoplasmopsis gallinacea]|uniref:DNA adenine methylase n=1 Tax=Mycoplasmopsis gallinacea TaxID=29556 RepID=UPI001E381C9C|nr:DNA adenine methylase [Mycoplasmopsis gallinacea]